MTEVPTYDERVSPGIPPRLDPVRAAALERRLFGRQQRIRHFVIGECIGSGAHGQVRRAFDPRLRRELAIKQVAIGSASELTRLEQEAQTLARLSHPNVVQIHESGLVDASTYFIAMEFVAGVTLEAWLSDQPRGRKERLAVFAQIAEGLAAVHAKGLAHRDFKPANVIVGLDGRPRIVDFGLATDVSFVDDRLDIDSCDGALLGPRVEERGMRLACAAPSAAIEGKTRETATAPAFFESSRPSLEAESTVAIRALAGLDPSHGFKGTPRYAAPEQFLGARTDTRTDQFAFCVCLFEAMLGQHPFPGRGFGGLAQRVSSGDIAWPIRQRVPRWLKGLLSRGLHVDPEKRHPDLESIEVILRRHASGGGKKTWLVWGAATAASLGGVAAVRTAGPRRDCDDAAIGIEDVWGDERRDALARRATGNIALSNRRVVVNAIDGYADRWIRARQRVCLLDDEETRSARTACLADELSVFDELVGLVTEEVGRPQTARASAAARFGVSMADPSTCDDPDRAADRAERSSSAGRGIGNTLRRARVLRLLGHWSDAQRRADEAFDAATAEHLPRLAAVARYQQGAVALVQGDTDSARVSLTDALRRAESTGNALLAIEIQAHLALAEIQGDVPSAAAAGLIEAALGRLESTGVGGSELEGWVRAAAGNVYFVLGDSARALQEFETALGILREHLGEDDPRPIALEINTEMLSARGLLDPKGAAARADDALERLETAFGEGDPLVSQFRIDVSALLRRAGRTEDAAAQLRLALEHLDTAPDNALAGRANTELAFLMCKQKLCAEASDVLTAARWTAWTNDSNVRRRDALRWTDVATLVYSGSEQWTQALDAVERARELRIGVMPPDPKADAKAVARHVFLLHQVGQPCIAASLLDQHRSELAAHMPAALDRIDQSLSANTKHCRMEHR